MTKQELLNIIQTCYAELKDFQKATADNIDRKFYEENKSRHLLADEVGLGKTIVAKGVIAKAMERHLKSSNRDSSFRVVYICSNQALTGQNLTKLNIFNRKEFIDTDRGRLVFQAFKEGNDTPYQISSLTPSTSFRLKKGTGIRSERKLIWLILSESQLFATVERKQGLGLALLGNVKEEFTKSWLRRLDQFKNRNIDKVRQEVFSSYTQSIKNKTIELDSWYYKPIRNELNLSGDIKLEDILLKYADILTLDNVKQYEGPKRILGTLRSVLTDVCLDFLEADLYIMDEFQRFKDLIETDHEKQSEAAIIAQKVFNNKKAKVLMMSATPFKPFTTSIDASFEEEHHKEFTDVLKFLFQESKKIDEFDQYRKMFFSVLRRPEEGIEGGVYQKDRLEQLFREVISRTERLIVSDDKNTLLKTAPQRIDPIKDDILNFVSTDKIISKLSEVSGKWNHVLVDFSKSAPYPLSFMDKYKVKEDLRTEGLQSKGLRLVIKQQDKAWINFDKIQRYKSLGDIPNANMRLLIQEGLMKNDLWRQLWIAPSLPYYELRGSFRNAKYSSKILVFSKWRMVPRSISAILSYESERLSIGSNDLKIEGEKKYTPDFSPNKPQKRQPRKPGKILALKMKEDKPQTMSAFTLIYPSLSLANCHDIRKNIQLDEPLSLNALKEEIKNQLIIMVQSAQLHKHKRKPQKTANWYWVAPLLLDKYYHGTAYNSWLKEEKFKEADYLYKKQSSQSPDNFTDDVDVEDEDRTNSNVTVLQHFHELKKVFLDPDSIDLGEFPDDLYEVLALQVIASPAICSMRVLSRLFHEDKESDLLNKSLDISSEFHALFDKPESIAVIKIASIERDNEAHDYTYWKDVLEYCTNGNLQSVLDEFSHLLESDFKTLNGFTERIRSSINIRTTNLRVDDRESFLTNKHPVMRSHYAVDFGTQNIDVEKGLNRVKSILANFNSPFRPFVLASTSIGQEGLDFHYYCRKVMHWNLPANPIDVEQREGRVNRYKGLVIRQGISEKYKKHLSGATGSVWDFLFQLAELHEGKNKNKPELVPYWHIEPESIHLERLAPLIPYSREVQQMQRIIRTLTLYRLTFGQPRQEELVETLSGKLGEEDLERLREKLLINLSPVTYPDRHHSSRRGIRFLSDTFKGILNRFQ